MFFGFSFYYRFVCKIHIRNITNGIYLESKLSVVTLADPKEGNTALPPIDILFPQLLKQKFENWH